MTSYAVTGAETDRVERSNMTHFRSSSLSAKPQMTSSACNTSRRKLQASYVCIFCQMANDLQRTKSVSIYEVIHQQIGPRTMCHRWISVYILRNQLTCNQSDTVKFCKTSLQHVRAALAVLRMQSCCNGPSGFAVIPFEQYQ